MKKLKIIILSITFVSHWAAGQDVYRNKNWQPQKGRFYFSQAITWTFLNTGIPVEDRGHGGEFTVYVDPPTGTMLFTPEAYGNSSEMTDFIIVFQNGRYIEGFTDEFGSKRYMIDTLAKFAETTQGQKWIKNDFKQLVKPTGKSRNFGGNNHKGPVLRAKSYELGYLKTNDKSTLYLTEQPYPLLPVYLFNDLDSEAKLPVNVDFSQIVPLNYWVVESTSEITTATKPPFQVSVTVSFIGPTEYFIDLNERTSMKKLQ